MAEAVDQGSFEVNRYPLGEEQAGIENDQMLHSAAAIAGDKLRDAAQRLFERMAERHGISVEGARLAALYSHAELTRMVARREREALA